MSNEAIPFGDIFGTHKVIVAANACAGSAVLCRNETVSARATVSGLLVIWRYNAS